MIAETQVLMLATTGLVFAVVSIGILGRTQEHKREPVTPASHGHFDFNQYPPDGKSTYEPPSKEEIPRHAADKVADAIGHHYTPSKEEVDALVEAYVNKHKDAPVDSSDIRKAVTNYLIKEHYKLHDSSP